MIGRGWARAALGIALCAASAQAHDLWIEPTTFLPEPGQVVGVRLRVGQRLYGEPLPLLPSLVKQFVVDDGSTRKPVSGRRGADPAGAMRAAAPGLHVIGYHSHPSSVELAADKFNAYLIEEGLDAIIALRERRHETGAPARDLFARCAKSLVLAGAPNQAHGDRRLGFPLELVAERNPYAMGADQDFPVHLTYDDRPLARALVVAISGLNPQDSQSQRSDAEGRVRFRLRAGGMWLIKAVHMVPAPGGADWVSLWASLTFLTLPEPRLANARPSAGRTPHAATNFSATPLLQ